MDRYAAKPLVVSITILLSVICWHSESSSANIGGLVMGSKTQPIPNVMISATNKETRYGSVAFSDAAGRFNLTDLPAGAYFVFAEKEGYALDEKRVVLDDGEDIFVNVVLERILGAQPASPNIPRPNNFAKRLVFYGTDRKPLIVRDRFNGYGAQRGDLNLGVCEVSIPRDHRLGKLESPSIQKLEFRPDPNKHIVLLTTSQMLRDDFGRTLQQAISQSKRRNALVFIHGYNVTFEDAVRRTAQISYDLGFDGVPILYSWPSNGSLIDYIADGEQAQRAAGYLRTFLEFIVGASELEEVHLIAHSMGNRVLTDALKQLVVQGFPSRVFGQIALVAPDIDSEIFRTQIAPHIAGAGRRFSLYASSHDSALALAMRLHHYPRAGDLSDIVTIVDEIDTIDATAVDTSLIGHSYYAENRSVIADLFSLIRNDTSPSQRFGMRPLEIAGRRYWKFAP